MIKKSLDKIFETAKIKKIKDKKPKKLTKNMKLWFFDLVLEIFGKLIKL